jgi:signal peptidase I
MANEINYQQMDNTENDAIKEKGLGYELFEWLESIAGATMVVLLVVIFLFRLAVVDGPSMEPTLVHGDALIVTDFDYTPKNGDIVIVDSEGLGKFIVKRVIATAGQKVRIDYSDGRVYVDGAALDELDYINAAILENSGTFEIEQTVPENTVFVLGDNRNHSTDSRDPKVGFVPLNDIYGEVVLRVYPFNKINTF